MYGVLTFCRSVGLSQSSFFLLAVACENIYPNSKNSYVGRPTHHSTTYYNLFYLYTTRPHSWCVTLGVGILVGG